jgi:hypothetical protein
MTTRFGSLRGLQLRAVFHLDRSIITAGDRLVELDRRPRRPSLTLNYFIDLKSSLV